MKRWELIAGLGLVWGALVVLGARGLLNYEYAAGTPGTPPDRWPSVSRIVRPTDKYTLVLLTHPDCPCTRASLAELEKMMAKAHGRLVSFVLFSKPGARAGEVASSELWKQAAGIPGVFAIYDSRGAGAEQFGGHVSGQSMLYDPSGRLVFSGGITSSRGHEGDNYGADAILEIANGNQPGRRSAPVFGCALHDPGAQTSGEDPSWK